MGLDRTPTAFISYSWESETHRDWVRRLAERLRHDCVCTTLDQWDTAPGDQLPEFMEKSIRGSDFVLIICTPKYKERSDGRTGGVGYEGDIISSEVFVNRNHRKFIPVLRLGSWAEASPSALRGKYYVDLRGDPYDDTNYADLLSTLLGRRPAPPAVNPVVRCLAVDASVEEASIDKCRLQLTFEVANGIGEPLAIENTHIEMLLVWTESQAASTIKSTAGTSSTRPTSARVRVLGDLYMVSGNKVLREIRSYFIEPGETVRFRVSVETTVPQNAVRIAFGLLLEYFTRSSLASFERHRIKSDRVFVFDSTNPLGQPSVHALSQKDLEHNVAIGAIQRNQAEQIARYFDFAPDNQGGPFHVLRDLAGRLAKR